MNIKDNYQKNKKNIFFSENKYIQTHREKLINIFENDRYDKKNNESLKNINLKNFIDFKYKYLIPEETSVINKNQENSYSIVSVNGQCSSFKDDKIEITNINEEDYNDFSTNDIIEKNDHFVNLNSLFLNSGFKIVIKKNNNIKIKISNIITDDNLTIFQKNNYICEEGSSLNLIEEYENKNNSTSNILNVIKLEKNSQIKHFLIQDNSPNHNLIITSHSSCKKNSTYIQKVYNFSEGYVRNSNDEKIFKTLDKNYIKELNNFYDKAKIICAKLDFCFDLSEIAPPTGNNYSDIRHHNANGNKIIADILFNTIINK